MCSSRRGSIRSAIWNSLSWSPPSREALDAIAHALSQCPDPAGDPCRDSIFIYAELAGNFAIRQPVHAHLQNRPVLVLQHWEAIHHDFLKLSVNQAIELAGRGIRGVQVSVLLCV